MGTLNPNLMNGKQRIDEIASILAVGILRLRNRQKANNFLDFRVVRSVHANDKGKGGFNNEKQCISPSFESTNHDR
jgi:hypothetical protein